MDYAHARHAGNAGDVFKHVALIAALEEMLRSSEPLLYVETHAGDGIYPLASVGEWGAGVQQIWPLQEGLVGRYAMAVRAESPAGAARPQRMPGSPLVAARMLRPQDRMLLHEIDPQSAQVLRRTVPQAEVREEDGLSLRAPAGRALVLVDPPYAQKQEWTDAARAAARLASTPLLLWYPVKALTRPRALIAELAKAGVHGTAVELHWTPLRLKRDRLNGCGVVFANVPRAAVASLCAALPDFGPALQTHGEWQAVEIGF
ncbi:MAG TPA: 23S rRNA (adenine(2030)-N(6))-methyltransferase RlmJ [Myxococcales bacterium]|nr:23S rRNA (adenine(2030)-N(6))-methyltransferase RlmJ [Myxococcales bacterium]